MIADQNVAGGVGAAGESVVAGSAQKDIRAVVARDGVSAALVGRGRLDAYYQAGRAAVHVPAVADRDVRARAACQAVVAQAAEQQVHVGPATQRVRAAARSRGVDARAASQDLNAPALAQSG